MNQSRSPVCQQPLLAHRPILVASTPVSTIKYGIWRIWCPSGGYGGAQAIMGTRVASKPKAENNFVIWRKNAVSPMRLPIFLTDGGIATGLNLPRFTVCPKERCGWDWPIVDKRDDDERWRWRLN